MKTYEHKLLGVGEKAHSAESFSLIHIFNANNEIQ